MANQYTPNNQLNVNPEQFINPLIPSVSYLLGFIWADGWVIRNQVRAEFLSSDAQQLKPIFLSTGKWCITTRTRPNRQPATCFTCTSKLLFSWLKSVGYSNSIAGANKILELLPNQLHNYWWRGYFDGDGTIYYNPKGPQRQVSISSGYGQNWDFAIKLASQLNIKYGTQNMIRKNGNGQSAFRITNKSGIKKFHDYIYQGQQFGLTRKQEKFTEALV